MAKCPIHEIAKRAGDAGIPFLIVGGYAVIAHGYVRATEDLDLIVQRGWRTQLSKMLDDLGMSVKNRAANFAQFDSQNGANMNVDLMFVSEGVFSQLEQSAIETKLESVAVRMVSLLHLIALKCHAYQHSKSIRRLKDIDDLIQLILINQLDLNEGELRATILKQGSTELYETHGRPAPTNDRVLRETHGLEFLDWSGMQPHRSRMTFEEAVRWNDELLAMFPPKRRSSSLEAKRRCYAEFIL